MPEPRPSLGEASEAAIEAANSSPSENPLSPRTTDDQPVSPTDLSIIGVVSRAASSDMRTIAIFRATNRVKRRHPWRYASSAAAAASVFHPFERRPFEPFQVLGHDVAVGDDDHNQGIGMDPLASSRRSTNRRRWRPAGRRTRPRDRPAAHEPPGWQTGSPGPMASRSGGPGPRPRARRASSSSTWLGGRPPVRPFQLVMDVVKGLGEPIGLQRRGDRKWAGLAAAIEVTAHAVGKPALLAQLRIEPGVN